MLHLYIKDLALESSQDGQHVMHCVAPSPHSSNSFEVGSIVAVHLSYRRLHTNLEEELYIHFETLDSFLLYGVFQDEYELGGRGAV